MKPLFIVLALVGVIFFAILLSSRSNAAVQAPEDSKGREDLAHTYRPPGIVSLIGSALGRWSPKVKFTQTAYTVAGVPVVVTVPESDDTFRRATIRVAPPNCDAVKITYQAFNSEGKDEGDGEGKDMQLDRQIWSGTESEPCVGSFVVRPKGGKMTIACASPQGCSITLE